MTKNSLIVNVTNVDGEAISQVDISLSKGGGVIQTEFTYENGYYIAKDIEPNIYLVIVNKVGFDENYATVRIPSGGSCTISVILGTSNMPYYYTGKTRIPFNISFYFVGALLRNPEETEGLLSFLLNNQIISEPLESAVLKQGFRVYHLPDTISMVQANALKSQLFNFPEMDYIGTLVYYKPVSVMFLDGRITVDFASKALIEVGVQDVTSLNFELKNQSSSSATRYVFDYIGFPGEEFLNKLDQINNLVTVKELSTNIVANRKTLGTPGNFLFPEQWNLKLMNVPLAWQKLSTLLQIPGIEFGSSNIRVAVYDQGIESTEYVSSLNDVYATHPQFIGPVGSKKEKVVEFYDFKNELLDNSIVTLDHGSLVAGIIAAPVNNDEGFVGVAPNARLMGFINGPTENIDAIFFEWLAGFDTNLSQFSPPPSLFEPLTGVKPPDIVNNSWSINTATLDPDVDISLHHCAIYGRKGKGVLNFWAAGNAGIQSPVDIVHAAHEKVMAVAASTLDNSGVKEIHPPYSSFGPNIQFCAPSHDEYVGPNNDRVHNPPVNYAILGTDLLHGSDHSNISASNELANMPGKAAGLDIKLVDTALSNSNFIFVSDSSSLIKGQWILIGGFGSGNFEFIRVKNTGDIEDVVTDYNRVVLNSNLQTATSYGVNTPIRVLSLFKTISSITQPNQITLSDAKGFIVGQEIFIGDPASPSSIREINVIQQVAGNTLTLKNNLANGNTYGSGTNVRVIGGTAATTITANAIVGATSITVKSTAGFQIGFAIFIGTPGSSQTESRMITNIPDGITLTLNQGLYNAHPSTTKVVCGRPSYTNQMGGTSAAAPEAAGVAALVLSVNPKLSWVEVRDIIRQSAFPIEVEQTSNIGKWVDVDGNPVLSSGNLILTGPTTTLVNNISSGISTINVDDATDFEKGQAIQIGDVGFGEEIRVIKRVDLNANVLHIDPITLPHSSGDNVLGGVKPHYSQFYGHGRIDAFEAVALASDYSHAFRDLMVRDYLFPDQIVNNRPKQDEGQSSTAINITPINSPDIWLSNTDTNPSGISLNIDIPGPNESPSNGISTPAFTGVGINDFRVRGMYAGTTTDTYEIEIESTGTPDRFKWRKNNGSYDNNNQITSTEQQLDQGIIIKFDGTTGHTVGDKWTFTGTPMTWQVYARVINIGNGGPGNNNPMRNLDAWIRLYVAFSDGAPVSIQGVTTPFLFPRDWKDDNDISTLDINNSPSTNTTYFLGETHVAEQMIDPNGFLIVKQSWSQENVPAENTALKPYLLVHVSPHDGPIEGYGAEHCNNLSFKEIAFTSFEFKGPGGFDDMPNPIDVDDKGTLVNQQFNINIKANIGSFETGKTQIEIIRETSSNIKEKYIFKFNGSNWVFDIAPPSNWLTINPPVLIGTNTAATGSQTFIGFSGNFNTSKLYSKVTLKAVINSSSTSVSTSIGEEKIEITINEQVQPPSGFDPAAPVEFVPLGHAFLDFAEPSLAQVAANAFGPNTTAPNDKFRVTSSFTATTDVNAYAVTDGDVMVQRDPNDNNRVNLILRPRNQCIQGFTPVKYFIYRGLRLDEFFDTTDNTKVRAQSGASEWLGQKLYPIHLAQNTGDFLAKALGYDPSNADQLGTALVDKYFFRKDADFQLPPISKGDQLGKFYSTANNVFGFEVIMEDGPLSVDFDFARKIFHEVDISGITGVTPEDDFDRKTKREEILAFMDPAAYYGLHITPKGIVQVRSGTNPSDSKKGLAIYDEVVSKFYTKNVLYLDIRNEVSFSYNFFENYNNATVDPGKNLLLGTTFTDDNTNNLVAKEYKYESTAVYNWPILALVSTQTTSNENFVYIKLRLEDNLKPTLFVENADLASVSSNPKFVEGVDLFPNAVNSAYTNVIGLKYPNTVSKENIARHIKLRYNRQFDNTTVWNTKSLQTENELDVIFSHINQIQFWDSQDKVKWVHRSDKRYVDGSSSGFTHVAERGIAFEGTGATPDRVVLYAIATDVSSNILSPEDRGKVYGVGSQTKNASSIYDVRPLFKYGLSLNTISDNSSPVTLLSLDTDPIEHIPIENALSVGITNTQLQNLLTTASALGLSPKFPLHLKFLHLGNFTDTQTSISYDKFQLGVHGLKDDGEYDYDFPTGVDEVILFAKNSFSLTLTSATFSSQQPPISTSTRNIEEKVGIQEKHTDRGMPVLAVDQGDKTFIAQGIFPFLELSEKIKEKIIITGSTGNNGNYTVTALEQVQDGNNNNTLITVLESIPNATADGTLSYQSLLWEDYFIRLDSNIEQQVEDFITDIGSSTDLTNLTFLVEQYAADILDTARVSASNNSFANADDRPLYWARIKMEVALKNHPLVLNNSIVTKNIIDIFEKFSRGRFTVDFSGAPVGAKKILISGFDPFFLNPANGENTRQSNPSGAVALVLHGLQLTSTSAGETGYIQSVLFPVRFKDFDDGVAENFFHTYLQASNADIIITISQGLENYDIERFASKFRNLSAAYHDNMGEYGNAPAFYLPNQTNVIEKVEGNNLLPEFLETKLPYLEIVPGSLGNNTVVFNQSYGTDDPGVFAPYPGTNSGTTLIPAPPSNVKARRGSGGEYLSNEIFYRVSLLRNKVNSNFPSGHLHLPVLQETAEDFDAGKTKDLIQKVVKIIKDALDGL